MLYYFYQHVEADGENSLGPSKEPCGTPIRIDLLDENSLRSLFDSY